MNTDSRVAIESRSLVIDQWLMLAFAIVGLLVFWLSAANAMALDAMYSMIGFVTAWVARSVLRSARKGPDEDNPWGRAWQENLYVLFRSLILLGILLASAIQAVYELLAYFTKGEATEPEFGYVAAYGLIVAIACMALGLLHRHNARRVGGSAILTVESHGAFMDAAIGLGIAVSLGIVALIPEGTAITNENFNIKAVADGFVVLALCIALVLNPARNLVTETKRLAGSRVDTDLDDEIEEWLDGWLHATADRGFEVVDVFAVDHGGSVSVDISLAYPGAASVETLDQWREAVTEAVGLQFPGVAVTVLYSRLPLHAQIMVAEE